MYWVPLIGVDEPDGAADGDWQGIGLHGLAGEEPLRALAATLGDARTVGNG